MKPSGLIVDEDGSYAVYRRRVRPFLSVVGHHYVAKDPSTVLGLAIIESRRYMATLGMPPKHTEVVTSHARNLGDIPL